MKLTKKLEAEILKLYHKYWHAYLNGKMKTMSSLMDTNCHVIGSGMGEVFKNKKDAVKYYTDTADQIAGASEMRNRNISMASAGNNILVTEESDFYVLMEGSWVFYGQGRFSTLFGKTEKKWLILQQHGSLPDSRTGGGEQLNTDKIKEENLRLKEAIKRRTIELEHKNNELKIEASLERIRTVAMSMQKSEGLLDVVEILNGELYTLGFTDIRNTTINIFNDTKEIFLNYDYSDYGVGGISEVAYNSHPINSKFVIKMREASQDLMITEFTGNELDEWRKWRSDEGQMPDPKLDQAESLYYYEYSIGVGSIGISTFSPINEDQPEILKKIRNVFDLAYRRYTDIAQAEAYAREAQIEAALEKIRSRSLAMHKSGELQEVVNAVYDRFIELDIKVDSINVNIFHEGTKHFDVWAGVGGKMYTRPLHVPYIDFGATKELMKSRESGNKFLHLQYSFDEKNKWWEKAFEVSDLKHMPEERKRLILESEGWITVIAVEKNSGIQFNRYSNELFSEKENDIQKRFAKVFEQAYVRFLDLQKAEVQAREAQIEAAIERVRSKAMAMHKSNDLTSTVATLFEQLVKLGLETIRLGIGIFHDGKTKRVDAWTISSNDKSDSVQLSGNEMLEGHALLDGIFDAWQNQHDYSYLLKGKDLSDYYNVVADSDLPVSAPEVNHENTRQYYHCIMFPAGGLFAFRESEFTTEAKQLMRRFADVFHLTFIRHLDLKNAEAQNKIIKAENERKSQELDEARELQLAMLPKELPQLPNLEIAVYMQTATEVGGDYYDFHVGFDGILTTVIGDATGHGMKAGTIVTITKSLFNSLASSNNILKTFGRISKAIKDMNFRQLSMCLTMLKIDGNSFTVSSAAMPPIYIYRNKMNSIEELEMRGMPLGALREFQYEVLNGKLEQGDTILMLSDGLPELSNDHSKMYGYDRVIEEFESVGNKDPQMIVEHLKNSASDWVYGNDPDDDVTFVVIKAK